MENIVLVGFMGSGKTSVGRALADKLKLDFVDMDEVISREEGKSITMIFSESGEAYFRDLETGFLRNRLKDKHIILSTGGGVVLKEENRELLRKLGKVIFLNTPFEQILLNVKHDTTRPLLQKENAEQVILELMQTREPIYFESANIIIQTKGKSVKAIAEEIIQLL